ncbi:VOC family protein [Brachybacterium sp. FME24]|uniref:VOC family protein n=1 Tax=Brachybacterium sp. FME24 TaxID=2742605 RepID=UPI001868D0DF|nr:VOC family protein [Brachybacterium sp. FME24]
MTTAWHLTIDCSAPAALARFWAAALGYEPAPVPAGFDSWEAWLIAHEVPEAEWDDGAYLHDPQGSAPKISFLRVPEPKIAKNRLHLDLQVGGGRQVPAQQRWPRIRREVERLTDLGARVVQEVPGPDGPDHVIMADPEGNEFCVV